MSAIEMCRIPVLIGSFLAIVSNVIMVRSIHANKKHHKSFYFIIVCLGLSNIVLSILLIIRGIYENYFEDTNVALEVTTLSAATSSYFMQLGANHSLALDRYIAISQPLRYRLSSWLRSTKKFLACELIIIAVCSIIMVCICIIQYQKQSYLYHALGLIRLVGCLSIIVIYYKIVRSFKASRLRVANQSSITEVRASTVPQNVRDKQETHLIIMSIGVTGSFIMFTLPIILYNSFLKFGKDCNTVEGKALVASVTIMDLNLIFDPVWYFYMESRKRQLRRSQMVEEVHSNRKER